MTCGALRYACQFWCSDGLVCFRKSGDQGNEDDTIMEYANTVGCFEEVS